MANVDTSLMQKVLYVSQRKRKSDIHHNAKLNDLRRSFEVAKRIFSHFPKLIDLQSRLKTPFR